MNTTNGHGQENTTKEPTTKEPTTNGTEPSNHALAIGLGVGIPGFLLIVAVIIAIVIFCMIQKRKK